MAIKTYKYQWEAIDDAALKDVVPGVVSCSSPTTATGSEPIVWTATIDDLNLDDLTSYMEGRGWSFVGEVI